LGASASFVYGFRQRLKDIRGRSVVFMAGGAGRAAWREFEMQVGIA
jgi:hypothetical protein